MMKIIGIMLYLIGLIGIGLNRRDIVKVLIGIELMLIGIITRFMESSVNMDDIVGEVFSLMVLTVAASESAVGLGLMISYGRIKGDISLEEMRGIQG